MSTYHGGPVEFIGSKFRRSVPQNITRVRTKNAARDSQHYGQFKVKIIRNPEWLDLDLMRECKRYSEAKAFAKLFLERYIFRYNGKWYVKCV